MFSVGGDLAPLLVIYHCVINYPQTWWFVLLTKLLFEQGLVVRGLFLRHLVSTPRWVTESSGGALTGFSDWWLRLAVGWTSPGTVVGTWPLPAAARLPPNSGWVPTGNISRGPSRNCMALYHLALESWTVSFAMVPVPLDSRRNLDTTSTSHGEEVTWEGKILAWPSLQNPCNHTHSHQPVNLPSTTASEYLLPCIHSTLLRWGGKRLLIHLFFTPSCLHTHTPHSQEVSA